MPQATDCLLCGDALHLVALPEDEYGWVDSTGSRTGVDADLRRYGGDAGYARLGWLFRTIREHQTSRRGTLPPVEYARLMGEYLGLSVRLDGSHATWHTHYPQRHARWAGEVPEHCGRPMWLRPSGWHCRNACGTVGPVEALAFV